MDVQTQHVLQAAHQLLILRIKLLSRAVLWTSRTTSFDLWEIVLCV
jgi:hypothetical protein